MVKGEAMNELGIKTKYIWFSDIYEWFMTLWLELKMRFRKGLSLGLIYELIKVKWSEGPTIGRIRFQVEG